MPRKKPIKFLSRLGRRMRARREHLNRTAGVVAAACEISRAQLFHYEAGLGHPPAATLHRIAMSLGTSSSHLMGETMDDYQAEEMDVLVKLYADPFIGPVTRWMQEMSVPERRTVHTIIHALARQPKPPQTIEAMR